MRTAIISLLLVALLLFCSSQCDGEEQDRTSEWSLPSNDIRVPADGPTDPQAIRETLQRYLRAEDARHSLEFYTLQRLGDQILPYVIEAGITENGKEFRVYHLLGYVLKGLGAEARQEAASKLLEVLTDKDTSIDLAHGILDMISYLGEPGLVIETELIELRQTRPDLEYNIDDALIGIGSTLSGSICAQRLGKKPSELLLAKVASCRTRARDAGPEVAKLLNHPDWDLRIEAVRTLGFIGYTEAIPALIALLDDPNDVRLNRMAAESLGRLGDRWAVEALKETAAHHWHPAVRDKAKSALEHITAGTPYGPGAQGIDRLFEDIYWGIKWSEAKTPDFLLEPPESKLYKATSPKKVRELSYRGEIISTRAADEKEQRATKGKNASIVINEDNRVIIRKPVERIPDVALRMENGWLVGSDRGEFGGELVFVADDGQRSYLVRENVSDLFRLGDKIIALTGLSHLSFNSGRVYEIKPVEGGRWACDFWRALPGAPQVCGKLPSGEIFIRTSGGGDLILAEDGTFRMALLERGN